MGSQVILPYRGDGTEVRHRKLMGDLGQIVPLPFQIRDKRSVERVIQDSNVVINAISRRRESRNFSMHDITLMQRQVQTAAELGVDDSFKYPFLMHLQIHHRGNIRQNIMKTSCKSILSEATKFDGNYVVISIGFLSDLHGNGHYH